MAGLVPAIHAFTRHGKAWMPVTSTGMTSEKAGLKAKCDYPGSLRVSVGSRDGFWLCARCPEPLGIRGGRDIRLLMEHCKNRRRREVRARLEPLKTPSVLPKRANLRLRAGRKDHAADGLPECRAR